MWVSSLRGEEGKAGASASARSGPPARGGKGRSAPRERTSGFIIKYDSSIGSASLAMVKPLVMHFDSRKRITDHLSPLRLGCRLLRARRVGESSPRTSLQRRRLASTIRHPHRLCRHRTAVGRHGNERQLSPANRYEVPTPQKEHLVPTPQKEHLKRREIEKKRNFKPLPGSNW